MNILAFLLAALSSSFLSGLWNPQESARITFSQNFTASPSNITIEGTARRFRIVTGISRIRSLEGTWSPDEYRTFMESTRQLVPELSTPDKAVLVVTVQVENAHFCRSGYIPQSRVATGSVATILSLPSLKKMLSDQKWGSGEYNPLGIGAIADHQGDWRSAAMSWSP